MEKSDAIAVIQSSVQHITIEEKGDRLDLEIRENDQNLMN